MKVLIIGGTGFISGHIARKAEEEGHEVVLFNRGKRDPNSTFETISGDLNKLEDFKAELLALKPDVVVHSFALTEKHAQDFVKVFEGSGAHLIALSSADSYESFQKLNRGENTGDMPVKEDDELSRTKHYYAKYGAPDYDKNLMTAVMMDAHKAGQVNATVFRLPMVYGPGDFQYQNRHGDIIQHLLDGKKDIVMGAIEQAQVFTYGYVENMAAAVVHSFGHKNVSGEIYNLGEGASRTRRQWAELYAETQGQQFNFRILPPEVVGGPTMPQNFVMDISKFEKHTGFKDIVDVKEGIKRTFDWAKAHPVALKNVKVDYAADKALADKYEKFMQGFNPKPEQAGPKP